MKKNLKKLLSLFGFGIYKIPRRMEVWTNPPSDKKHMRIIPNATYAPWLNDKTFMEIYSQVKRNTLVDVFRCYELWSLAKQACNIEGDIIEIGVWRGGSGALLAKAVENCKTEKKVYLADTFCGVVKAGIKDTKYKGGEHSNTSIEIVKELLKSLSLSNVEIIVGMFPEDSGSRVSDKISLLHCDVDVYQSCKDIVEWAIPKLSTGSFLVFDDFGFSGCEGVATFCEEIKLFENFRFIHNLNGHAIFVKYR
jgi:O-methyltransferase